MKKFLALLYCLLMLPLCAAAETNGEDNIVVKLDGAEFFFTPIPDGYCLTRESSASVFNRLGLSQREMLPWMEEAGVYALMYDAALTSEVYVYAWPTETADYDDMTEYGETAECAYYASYLVEYGYDVAAVEMYVVPGGHKFVWTNVFYANEDGTVQHMSEYMTCKGGYDIRIVVFPFEGEVTEEHLALGDAIADSLWIMADAFSLDVTGN